MLFSAAHRYLWCRRMDTSPFVAKPFRRRVHFRRDIATKIPTLRRNGPECDETADLCDEKSNNFGGQYSDVWRNRWPPYCQRPLDRQMQGEFRNLHEPCHYKRLRTLTTVQTGLCLCHVAIPDKGVGLNGSRFVIFARGSDFYPYAAL